MNSTWTPALLLALLVAAAWPRPVEAGVMDGVYRGDAVATVVRVDGSTRSFALRTVNDNTAPMHRDWEIAPGGSLTLYFRTWTTGSAPPGVPDGLQAADNCQLRTYWGTTSTVHRTLHVADTCPANGASWTFHGTTTGTSSGTPIAGTLRLRIDVTENAGAADLYTASTDAAGQGFPGALRIGTTVAALAAAAYPAGSTFAATVAGEAIDVTFTATSKAVGQPAGDLTFRLLEGTAVLAATTATYATSTALASFTVGDALPARPAEVHVEVAITGPSSLTGLPWTHIHTATPPLVKTSATTVEQPATVNVDPRLFTTHLFQMDDPTFGTPPLSKAVEPERSPMEVGFHAARFVNARGEPLTGALGVDTRLQDQYGVAPAVTTSCASDCLDTRGGEPGWTDLAAWSNGGPVGDWNLTYDLTAPAHVDSDVVLQGGNATLTIRRLESGGGDPLKLTISPLRADLNVTVTFALAESFLNGTARTGNANATWIYVRDPDGQLIVNGSTPFEIGLGTYVLTFTPAKLGTYLVLAKTLDPVTRLPVGTSNVFHVANDTEQRAADNRTLQAIQADLGAHRELSPEYTAQEAHDNQRSLLGDLAWLLWIAFVVLTRLIPQKPLRLAVNLAGYAVVTLPVSDLAFLSFIVFHSAVVLYDLIAVIQARR